MKVFMSKRLYLVCVLAICLMFVSITVANAAVSSQISPYASQYISSYSAVVTAKDDAVVAATFEIISVGTVNKVGATEIVWQEKSSANGSWQDVATYTNQEYSNMMAYNAGRNRTSVSYQGTAGYYYRAVIYFYAENGGYDTRTYTTNWVLAD